MKVETGQNSILVVEEEGTPSLVTVTNNSRSACDSKLNVMCCATKDYVFEKGM